MSLQELDQRLIHFKHRLNMHLMERNSNNLNESYVTWIEENIESIKTLIWNLKQAQIKKAS